MSCKVADIQKALAQYVTCKLSAGIVMPNVFVKGGPWESDLIYVAKSFYWHEFEIKLTAFDYQADFQKKLAGYDLQSIRKHAWLADPATTNNGRYRHLPHKLSDLPRPKHFWFVCPEEVTTYVPDHCGLLHYLNNGRSDGVLEFREVRKAPRIPKPKKLTADQLFNLAWKAASRLQTL